jgi:gluconate 2-dehydrogenase gamma chain
MSVLLFLNQAEAATLETMAARIIPGDSEDPGAREAGSVVYIDRLLAGFGREQQTIYRVGLRLLDACTSERYGRAFSDLTAVEQDELLAELDQRHGDGERDDLGSFFAVVREHVVQGFFCDPAYGGNRDGAGWRAVGFPGARWGYSARQMGRDFDSTTIPVTTLADLYDGDRSIDHG